MPFCRIMLVEAVVSLPPEFYVRKGKLLYENRCYKKPEAFVWNPSFDF